MKSKNIDSPVVTKESSVNGNIVINNLQVRLLSVDRTAKDIKSWKDALQSAERIFLPNRSDLYDLYSTVILDGHLTGIIEKRISTVLNKVLYFEKEEKKDDDFDQLIESAKFRDLLCEILLRKFWGLSGFEFIPGEIFDFNIIPRKHIKPDLKMITQDQWSNTGIIYDGVWNLWVLGNVNDLGLLLKCSPYAIWKKGNMADWAQYIEIFGQPVIITKYDAYDIKTKLELDEVMKNAGSSLRLQIPNQANFEMLDGKQSNGNGDLQNQFRKACNDEMSIVVLGNTESTDSSDSSGFAQSKVHSKQQLEIIKTDMVDVLNAINSAQFTEILKTYGYRVEGGRFCFKKELDVTELQQRSQIDSTLAKVIPIDDNYFYETYGIPKPDNYDELKTKMEEQRKESLNSPQPPAAPVPKQKEKQKPYDQIHEDDETIWKKIRAKLADFFDPAP